MQRSPGSGTVRTWLLVVAVVAALAVAFGVGLLVGSGGNGDDSETTADAETTDVPDIVEQWGDAFVAEDRDALAALYTTDATFNCRAFDFTIGSDEITDVVMHDGTDFVEFEPTSVLVGDEVVVVEYDVVAVSPSGRDVSTPLIAVFDVTPDGLLAASTIDYDRAELFPG
jgi:ketosteroid isomerase-like protein